MKMPILILLLAGCGPRPTDIWECIALAPKTRPVLLRFDQFAEDTYATDYGLHFRDQITGKHVNLYKQQSLYRCEKLTNRNIVIR